MTEELVYRPPIDAAPVFDTHAHYDDPRFAALTDELFSHPERWGILGALTCSCDGESCRKNAALADKYESVYFAAGIHPENLDRNTPLSDIKQYAAHKKCVAIGEIGLDYHYRSDNRQEQLAVFEAQLLLAKELGLPVIVHDREAHADTLRLLQKHRPRGVVHCFSGSEEMAAEILKCGMYIGVGGVITFRNAKRLPQVVQNLPPDRLLLETDCPYLAPAPYRGKLCYSGMITLSAERIGELLSLSANAVIEQSNRNAKRLFFPNE